MWERLGLTWRFSRGHMEAREWKGHLARVMHAPKFGCCMGRVHLMRQRMLGCVSVRHVGTCGSHAPEDAKAHGSV
jgi:hypothetical protein